MDHVQAEIVHAMRQRRYSRRRGPQCRVRMGGGEFPIARMWDVAEILEANGVEVEFLSTRDPGIVIYEDGWQVVAKPRKGARVPW